MLPTLTVRFVTLLFLLAGLLLLKRPVFGQTIPAASTHISAGIDVQSPYEAPTHPIQR